MLGVGQFSKICMVSVKALHHYDKIGLLKPRYIDDWTGYRYYGEEQIARMLLIGRLKRYGFALSEIRELLACGDKDALLARIRTQKEKLTSQMSQTAQVIGEMERHLRNFERTGDMMDYQNQYDVQVQETTAMPVVSSRQQMSTEEFGKYFGLLFEKIARERLTVAGPTMAVYHDEEFNHECNDTEVAVQIVETGKADRTIGGGLCAVTVHKGGYGSLSDAYGAITRWIARSEYEMAGAPYEVYRRTQMDHLPVEDWETDIFFPLKKK